MIDRLEFTLSRMSQRLMATPHGLRLYSQTLRALEETKARRETAMRNLTPEEVKAMLRSIGQLFCDHVEHHASALARHMCRVLSERCFVDVAKQHCQAEKIMEIATCEWGNSVIDAIEKYVKDQIAQAQQASPSGIPNQS